MKKIYFPFLALFLFLAPCLAHSSNPEIKIISSTAKKRINTKQTPNTYNSPPALHDKSKHFTQSDSLLRVGEYSANISPWETASDDAFSLKNFSPKVKKEDLFTSQAKSPTDSPNKGLGGQGDIFVASIGWNDDLGNIEQPPEAFEKVSLDSTIDRTPGVNINLGARFQNFSIHSTYAQALEVSGFSELLSRNRDSEAKIWNSELAYTTDWMAREMIFAVAYQKALEPAHLDLPGERYSTRASLFLSKDTSLSFEYYHDRDNNIRKNDDDENDQGFITRLGFSF